MANPLLKSVRTPSPGPSSHLGADGFSGLSSCVGWTSPAQLPTVRSALQSSTAFKQEPRCPPVNHLAHPPHPQHDGLRTAHTFSTFSTSFTRPACTHSHAAQFPKAALRDHGEHESPRGVCSRPPSGSARTGRLMSLCLQVDCPLGDLDSGSSGSWRSLTSQLSASGLPCTFPTTPSANDRIPGSPFN